MIQLQLVLHNPWSRGHWRSIWTKHRRLSTHKTFEIQLYRFSSEFLGFRLDTSWRGRDHAGPQLELIVCGYTLSMQICDNRHWDYDHGRWMIYNEDDVCQN